MNRIKLKEPYILANCCNPSLKNEIVGYYSYNNELKVHTVDCPNLEKVEDDRILTLIWDEILLPKERPFDKTFLELDEIDLKILRHHQNFGVDYSHVVARAVNISKEEAFEKHKNLREIGALNRVDPLMIQYRKGVVDNKWIKHRNHTYYELSDEAIRYLNSLDSKDQIN